MPSLHLSAIVIQKSPGTPSLRRTQRKGQLILVSLIFGWFWVGRRTYRPCAQVSCVVKRYRIAAVPCFHLFHQVSFFFMLAPSLSPPLRLPFRTVQTSMVALDSVAGAAAAGQLYPASTEEDPIDIDIYSDEEAAGGGLWSATGTGTEGEDATDTGGDYTEGDAEYETPGEHNLEDTGELKRSLSRCSTAKGTLSNLPDSFLSSSQETT
ncbi:unnamed protein product, partial [Ectocarpus sp. 13 AM-2016]